MLKASWNLWTCVGSGWDDVIFAHPLEPLCMLKVSWNLWACVGRQHSIRVPEMPAHSR